MAVTPCSAALFPMAYICAGVKIEYGAFLAPLFSFNSSLTLSLAARIAELGTILLKSPFGSGNSAVSVSTLSRPEIFQYRHLS